MAAQAVSPGRLYGLLCDEFRRLRPTHCTSCRPALIEAAPVEHDGFPNWIVPRSMNMCGPCNQALDRAARKLGPLYRLVDLTLPSQAVDEGIHPYGIDARVDFVAPGQFMTRVRALSPDGKEVFSAVAESATREGALQEKSRLIGHVTDLLRTAMANRARRVLSP